MEYFNAQKAKEKISPAAYDILNKAQNNVDDMFAGTNKLVSDVSKSVNNAVDATTRTIMIVPNTAEAIEELIKVATKDMADMTTKLISDAVKDITDLSDITGIPGTATKYYTRYFLPDVKLILQELLSEYEDIAKKKQDKQDKLALDNTKKNVLSKIGTIKSYSQNLITNYNNNLKELEKNTDKGLDWLADKIGMYQRNVYESLYQYLYGESLAEKSKIDNKNATIKQLENKIRSLEKKKVQLLQDGKIDEKSTQIININKKIIDINNQIASHKDNINKLNVEISNKNSDLNSIKDEINRINKEIQQAKGIDEISAKINNLIDVQFALDRQKGIIGTINGEKRKIANQIALSMAVRIAKNAEIVEKQILKKAQDKLRTTIAYATSIVRSQLQAVKLTLLARIGL